MPAPLSRSDLSETAPAVTTCTDLVNSPFVLLFLDEFASFYVTAGVTAGVTADHQHGVCCHSKQPRRTCRSGGRPPSTAAAERPSQPPPATPRTWWICSRRPIAAVRRETSGGRRGPFVPLEEAGEIAGLSYQRNASPAAGANGERPGRDARAPSDRSRRPGRFRTFHRRSSGEHSAYTRTSP